MKIIKSKKGALFIIPVFVWIVLLVIFIGIPLGGIIKFLFTDKMPLILLGLLVLIVLFGKRKREGRI